MNTKLSIRVHVPYQVWLEYLKRCSLPEHACHQEDHVQSKQWLSDKNTWLVFCMGCALSAKGTQSTQLDVARITLTAYVVDKQISHSAAFYHTSNITNLF